MKIPSYLALRVVSFLLIIIGLSLLTFSMLIFMSNENSEAQHRMIMLGLGSLFLLVGIIGPVRVIFHGAQIPVEIKRVIVIQALVLPLSGMVFLFAGFMEPNNYKAWAYFIVGICALYSAIAGFYPLSKTLPDTLYIDEMMNIIQSTGITGNKKYSQTDQAFQRWTSGRKGIAVGQQAYDGTVIKLNNEKVLLSSFFDDNPLVLNLGSYSCPHHRKRMDELKTLMQEWQPCGVTFLTIYTAEAHAEDGWKLVDQYVNDAEYTNEADFCFPYAKNIHERKVMAEWLIDKKHFEMPIVLDTMEDKLLKAYNSWPIRLYIIHQGKIAYCGNQGPFGYDPSELKPVLQSLIDKKI